MRHTLVLLLLSAAAWAQPQPITPAHAQVHFTVGHLMSYAEGSFTRFKGSLTPDSVNWEVQADSVDTGNPNRDKTLRSADYFEVERYPTLSFQSTRVNRVDASHLQVTGNFTLHGVTRLITVPVTVDKGAYDCEFSLLRSEYKMTSGTPLVGDQVQVHLHVDAP